MHIKNLRELNPYLSEIEQSLPLRFSFAHWDEKDEVEQLHDWVRCRDFLGDVLWANKYKNEVSIYKFKFNPKETKINPDRLEMLIKFVKGTKNNFKNQIHLLNTIEEKNGFAPTCFYEIDQSHRLIVADKIWQSSVFMISLYTYLLKCICYTLKEEGNIFSGFTLHTTEGGYYSRINPAIHQILPHLQQIANKIKYVTGFPHETELNNISYEIHNNCGFVNVIQYHKEIKNNHTCEIIRKFL